MGELQVANRKQPNLRKVKSANTFLQKMRGKLI